MYFEIISEITDIEIIAKGRGIRDFSICHLPEE